MDITIKDYSAGDAKFHYRLSYGVATECLSPKMHSKLLPVGCLLVL